MDKIIKLFNKCQYSGSNFLLVILRFLIYKILYKKNILLHQHVKIKGIKNIEVKDRLEVGIEYVGFMMPSDKTLLNINGKLKIHGNYSIGRGCRFDIGRNAIVEIGSDGYMNCNTKLIIQHELKIGERCAISWDCQFLDDDFHEISYPGREVSNPSITIGDDVWIGCGVKIYKGTKVPSGCIIAADSVVRGVFDIGNSLIAGNPAKVIKENVKWEMTTNNSGLISAE